MKTYSFESANLGTIEFSMTGQYHREHCHDVQIDIPSKQATIEFSEADNGTVDEMFQWLVSQGVKFESKDSFWFNINYVSRVMIEGDMTQEDLLRKIESLTEEDYDKELRYYDIPLDAIAAS